MHDHLDSTQSKKGSYFSNVAVLKVLHFLVSTLLKGNERIISENLQEKHCTLKKKRETFEGHHCHHMHLSKNRTSFISLNLRNV